MIDLTAALLTPHTLGERIVWWSVVGAAVVALLELSRRTGRAVVQGIRRIWRWGKRLIAEVKDLRDRWHKLDELLQRELNPNGGASLKDKANVVPKKLEQISGQIATVRAENREWQHATAVVLDGLNETSAEEHRRLWKAIGEIRTTTEPPTTEEPHAPDHPDAG